MMLAPQQTTTGIIATVFDRAALHDTLGGVEGA